jgi:hypothetical protein
MKTKKQREEESRAWNNWKPGSGRKGWSPFDKPIPPVRDAATGHPIGKNGEIDWAQVVQEANQRDSQ